jgi:replication factor C small subunit
MSADKSAMWIEKYRPKTLDEYVFHDERMKTVFSKMVENKDIPGHLLLSGVQGTGKTTLALILINELGLDDTDVLTLNASDENNVEVMREKVKGFVSTFAMNDFKVVHLEEADFITGAGQFVLRRMMEEYADNARFILTCNYENKIIVPLKSRLQVYRFNAPDRDAVTEFAATVLISEKVKFDIEMLDKYVSVGYPDIRKIVNLLQQNTIDGNLLPLQTGKEAGDYKFELLELIERGHWVDARKVACENVAAEEWEDVYRFLYENLHKSPMFEDKDKWEAGIVIIADHLYKHGLVADPEINAAAMFIRLSQV